MKLFSVLRHPLPITIAAALTLSACAGKNAADGVIDRKYVARDVATLYTFGKDSLDAGRYRQAAAIFDEVERQHPYSVWARRAQLMSAFSYYTAQEYQDSISAAQRFLSLHPGNKNAPYAYYLIALSHYEQIEDVERDQQTTLRALNALTELTRRYPNTRYASDARLKIDLANDHLAGKEMTIGRFYQERQQYIAAIKRFENVVERYDTTSHAPEALHRMVESFLLLGIPEEARRTAAVLGSNYPGSKWYERSYKLIQKHG
ncbi:outer membrane protein assembly factor BamD [Pacificimonas sp. WHA3]|uniref:Outer membrane protein assembly factor BamD n=1 Tax=Pacificimonas pallii TaxID=2827236 RepID=A0ABS6SEA6_9SPHN|nr:outer membrane protein assembly factor BamD [Pacificimonas pallii]MBV7256747.1 outer membrane protein assembly factor BamD [Pacificimonas pallii]